MRNQSFITIIASNFALVLFACFAAPQLASAQKPSPGLEPVKKSCSQPDKVEVTELYLTPSNPQDGQSVNISMSIKNKCPSDTMPLSIDWDIGISKNRLAGAVAKLAAGESTRFTAKWTARPGSFKVHGGVTNNLSESAADQENNTRETSVTVIRYVTLSFEPLKAMQAGAYPSAQRVAFYSTDTHCSFSMTGLNNAQLGAPDELVMRYSCTSNTSGSNPDFPSCAAFKAFHNLSGDGQFMLKNNWKVKSVTSETRQGSWTKTSENRTGDNYIWVYGEGCAKRYGGQFERVVKIQIEGPEGTDPYQ